MSILQTLRIKSDLRNMDILRMWLGCLGVEAEPERVRDQLADMPKDQWTVNLGVYKFDIWDEFGYDIQITHKQVGMYLNKTFAFGLSTRHHPDAYGTMQTAILQGSIPFLHQTEFEAALFFDEEYLTLLHRDGKFYLNAAHGYWNRDDWFDLVTPYPYEFVNVPLE